MYIFNVNEYKKYSPSLRGRLAQLVERLPYKQNVGGSIPSAPTIYQFMIPKSQFYRYTSFLLYN